MTRLGDIGRRRIAARVQVLFMNLASGVANAWLEVLQEEGFEEEDVRAAVETMAQACPFPSLAEFKTHAATARLTRAERERLERPKLERPSTRPGSRCDRSRMISAGLYEDIKRGMPPDDTMAEWKIRMEMTDDDIAVRREEMRAMFLPRRQELNAERAAKRRADKGLPPLPAEEQAAEVGPIVGGIAEDARAVLEEAA